MSYFGSVLQDILRAKYKGCQYVCGETYESLVWMESNTVAKPTYEQLLLDKQDYEANQTFYNYEILRMQEYPSLEDQLDMLWHSMEAGEIPKSVAFYNARKTVKDTYPKENKNAS